MPLAPRQEPLPACHHSPGQHAAMEPPHIGFCAACCHVWCVASAGYASPTQLHLELAVHCCIVIPLLNASESHLKAAHCVTEQTISRWQVS